MNDINNLAIKGGGMSNDLARRMSIQCAVCGHEVQRVAWHDDPMTRSKIIAAYCHGDIDTMHLDDEILRNMPPGSDVPTHGVAFTTKRIESSRSESDQSTSGRFGGGRFGHTGVDAVATMTGAQADASILGEVKS